MNFLKNKRLAVLAAATPLLMTAACSYDYGPRLFPVGYGYDNADYHVPPSAKPIFKRRLFVEKCTHGGVCAQPVASNSDMMVASADLGAGNAPAIAGDWNYAAVDLVNRMVAGFGQPNEPIFLRRAAPGVVSEGDFYNALRQALTNKGVTLAHEAGESPFLMDYTISPVELSDASRQMLTVKLMSHGASVSEVSGLYKVEAAQATPGMPILPMSSPASVGNNAGAAPMQLRSVGEPRADANDGMTPPPLMTPMAGSTTETTVSTTATESVASEPPASLAPSTPASMPMGERRQDQYN
jgi:hypothetical protein